MILHELFITETISLVQHYHTVQEILESAVTTCIEDLEFAVESWIKSNPVPDTAARRLTWQYQFNADITAALSERLAKLVPPIIKFRVGPKLNVRFTTGVEQIKANAQVVGNKIIFNQKTFDTIASHIIDVLLKYAKSTGGLYGETVDRQLLRALDELDIHADILNSDIIYPLIKKLVSTVLHELTHIIQHSKQVQKGRVKTEYRSYLEPDVKQFYSDLRAMAAGAGTPEIYRKYRASPQEIAGFAQETALAIIDRYQQQMPDVKREINHTIDNYVDTYMRGAFGQPNDSVRYKVYKRFQKIVYKLVMDYIHANP